MRTRGFSLVEIIVAISLLSVCLVFIVTIFPTANVGLHKARDLEAASHYAVSLLEQARRSLNDGAQLPASSDRIVKLNESDFSVHQQVTLLEAQGSYALQEIAVKVAAVDGKTDAVKLVLRVAVRAR